MILKKVKTLKEEHELYLKKREKLIIQVQMIQYWFAALPYSPYDKMSKIKKDIQDRQAASSA